MKYHLFIFLISAPLLFISCEKQYNGNNSDEGDREPEAAIMLVKFTDDSYREYILAEKIGESSVHMRGTTPPVIEELIVGTIPYDIKMPNGFWAVNWRWGISFIYPPSNVLLPDKWETLTHWSQTWEMPEKKPVFKDYIEEVGIIPRKTIDTYLGINLDVSVYSPEGWFLYDYPWNSSYTTEDEIPDTERALYYTKIHQQDSLHQIYVQRLTDIINSGDFDNVYKKWL